MCLGCPCSKEPKGGRTERKSVYSEPWDPDDDDDGEKIVIPKTDEQRDFLKTALGGIIFFKNLEPSDVNEIIDAMDESTVTKGTNVITIGEDGEEATKFYIIQTGTYTVTAKVDGQMKIVAKYENKGSFGELALMYNQPRAATVKAETDGKLWTLDRTTFRRIVLRNAHKKRKLYEEFIQNVPILQSLLPNERMNVVDALEPRIYSNNELIISQGAEADGMYFVEEGTVKVMFTNKEGKKEEVNRVTKGGYFGELALLTKQKRAASIYAVGPVKCAFLDVLAFERLLGSCKSIMHRNVADYEKQLAKAFGGKVDIQNLR